MTTPEGPVLADLLAQRYGQEAASLEVETSDVLDLVLRHRSVRRFTTAPVSDAQLAAMLAAASSAATSSNMQTVSVVVVRDPATRAALGEVSGTSRPLAAAPVALVWLIDWSRNTALAARAGIADSWTRHLDAVLAGAIDTALAAENAVTVAESLGLGTCFIGSLRDDPDAVAELLGLPPKVMPLFGLAVGHPDPADRAGIKPRLPQSVVVHEERYQPAPIEALDRYDEVARGYFAGQGLQQGWVDRVEERFARPPGPRSRLRAAVERRGFPLD